MIVLSLILVIAAAVLLIAGFFQTGLTLIYGSIGACVLAMILLGIGVLQRKRSQPSPQAGGYGPGAGTTPVRPSGSTRPASRGSGAAAETAASAPRSDESDVVVRKTTAEEAPRKKAVKKVAATSVGASRPEQEPPAEGPATGADETEEPVADTKKVAARSTEKSTSKKAATKRASTKKAAKKRSATKKSTTKKAATKKAATKKAGAKKASTKKAAKKKSTKKTAKKTTGAAARQALAQVKGIGPAKQDALLARFGSLESIRDASVEQLAEVPGIGESSAKNLRQSLS